MHKVPQFNPDTGNLEIVDVQPCQYQDITLTAGESEMAIRMYKKIYRLQKLNTNQMAEALRQDREKKHFDKKTVQYFKKVNHGNKF